MVFLSVAAVNSAGLRAVTAGAGLSVAVDRTPPVTAPLIVGPPGDEHSTHVMPSVFGIHLSWAAFTEPHGMTMYSVAVGSTPGDSDVVAWRSVDSALSAHITEVPAVPHETELYGAVRGINVVGLAAAAVSPVTTVDATPPLAGEVALSMQPLDPSAPPAADSLWDSPLGHLSAPAGTLYVALRGFSDPDSGIASYAVGLGNTDGGSQLADFVPVPVDAMSALVHLDPARFPDDGSLVYATVIATNGAGGTVAVASAPALVSTAPPSGFTVAVEPLYVEAAEATLLLATDVTINWTPADHVDGLSRYEVAVGTARGVADTLDWTVAGNSSTLAWQLPAGSLTLSHAAETFVGVRAYSPSEVVHTEWSLVGFIADTSPPEAPDMVVTVGDAAGRTSGVTAMPSTGTPVVTFSSFVDPESAIGGYEVQLLGPSDAVLVPYTPHRPPSVAHVHRRHTRFERRPPRDSACHQPCGRCQHGCLFCHALH